MDSVIEALLRAYNGHVETFASAGDYSGETEAPTGAFCRVVIDDEFVSWAVSEFADVVDAYGGLDAAGRDQLVAFGPTLIRLGDSGTLEWRSFSSKSDLDSQYERLEQEYAAWCDD
ncbi:hypothetical protein [Gordonia sihwensis]|uniref:hypothetical protein n=1 Tax=Gordonia sihwensis TaxID=173559 RepID=UPI003D979AFA